jgi:hypothetical protein
VKGALDDAPRNRRLLQAELVQDRLVTANPDAIGEEAGQVHAAVVPLGGEVLDP